MFYMSRRNRAKNAKNAFINMTHCDYLLSSLDGPTDL